MSTPAQQRYLLSLIRQLGFNTSALVTAEVGRKLSLPRGGTIEEAVGSLSREAASDLIDRLKAEGD